MRTLLALAIISALTGCAQYSVSATDTDKSAVDFTQRMTVAMSAKLDKLITPVMGSTRDFAGYRTFETTFFPTEGGMDGINKSWTSYCSQRGGSYLSNACEDHNGNLLFFAKTWLTGGKGTTTLQHAIYVIEPTDRPSAAFMIAAEAAGYRTKGQLQQEKDAQAIRQLNQSIALENRKKQNAEAIFKSGVGSRVCKDSSGYGVVAGFREIGFVERIENGRINVSVQLSEMKGAPNLSPGGFRPYTGWFPPSLWYLC